MRCCSRFPSVPSAFPAGVLLTVCCLLATAAAIVSGCSSGDQQQLKACLQPVLPLLTQKNPDSHKTCWIIITFIKCVKRKLPTCKQYIDKTQVLVKADGLKRQYCTSPGSVATTTTTTTPAPTTPPPPTVHQLFSRCRRQFRQRAHSSFKSACRSAGRFLRCGQSVLWSSDFSVETYYLHAELLRNRAVFWRQCARKTLIQSGVGRRNCPHDVANRLTSCINVTYWQPVIAGDVKTFCRTTPIFLPCLSDLSNGCHDVRRLQSMADFLWNTFDLISEQCSQFGHVETVLDYDYDYGDASLHLQPNKHALQQQRHRSTEEKTLLKPDPPSPGAASPSAGSATHHYRKTDKAHQKTRKPKNGANQKAVPPSSSSNENKPIEGSRSESFSKTKAGISSEGNVAGVEPTKEHSFSKAMSVKEKATNTVGEKSLAVSKADAKSSTDRPPQKTRDAPASLRNSDEVKEQSAGNRIATIQTEMTHKKPNTDQTGTNPSRFLTGVSSKTDDKTTPPRAGDLNGEGGWNRIHTKPNQKDSDNQPPSGLKNHKAPSCPDDEEGRITSSSENVGSPTTLDSSDSGRQPTPSRCASKSTNNPVVHRDEFSSKDSGRRGELKPTPREEKERKPTKDTRINDTKEYLRLTSSSRLRHTTVVRHPPMSTRPPSTSTTSTPRGSSQRDNVQSSPVVDTTTAKPALQQYTADPSHSLKTTAEPALPLKTTVPLYSLKTTAKLSLQQNTTIPSHSGKTTAEPALPLKTTVPLLSGKTTAEPAIQQKTTDPSHSLKTKAKPALQLKTTVPFHGVRTTNRDAVPAEITGTTATPEMKAPPSTSTSTPIPSLKHTVDAREQGQSKHVHGEHHTPSTVATEKLPTPSLQITVANTMSDLTTPTLPVVFLRPDVGTSKPTTVAEKSEPKSSTDKSEPIPTADTSEPKPAADMTEPRAAAEMSQSRTAADKSQPRNSTQKSLPITVSSDMSKLGTTTEKSEPGIAAEKSEPIRIADTPEPKPAADKSEPRTAADKSQPKTSTEKSQPVTATSNMSKPGKIAEKPELGTAAEESEPRAAADKSEPTTDKSEPNTTADKSEPNTSADKSETNAYAGSSEMLPADTETKEETEAERELQALSDRRPSSLSDSTRAGSRLTAALGQTGAQSNADMLVPTNMTDMEDDRKQKVQQGAESNYDLFVPARDADAEEETEHRAQEGAKSDADMLVPTRTADMEDERKQKVQRGAKSSSELFVPARDADTEEEKEHRAQEGGKSNADKLLPAVKADTEEEKYHRAQERTKSNADLFVTARNTDTEEEREHRAQEVAKSNADKLLPAMKADTEEEKERREHKAGIDSNPDRKARLLSSHGNADKRNEPANQTETRDANPTLFRETTPDTPWSSGVKSKLTTATLSAEKTYDVEPLTKAMGTKPSTTEKITTTTTTTTTTATTLAKNRFDTTTHIGQQTMGTTSLSSENKHPTTTTTTTATTLAKDRPDTTTHIGRQTMDTTSLSSEDKHPTTRPTERSPVSSSTVSALDVSEHPTDPSRGGSNPTDYQQSRPHPVSQPLAVSVVTEATHQEKNSRTPTIDGEEKPDVDQGEANAADKTKIGEITDTGLDQPKPQAKPRSGDGSKSGDEPKFKSKPKSEDNSKSIGKANTKPDAEASSAELKSPSGEGPARQTAEADARGWTASYASSTPSPAAAEAVEAMEAVEAVGAVAAVEAPWGRDCTRPWEGHRRCTAIMLRYDNVGLLEEQCRTLRGYIRCLAGLWSACKQVTSFRTIPGTIAYILSNHDKKKCPTFQQPWLHSQ